MFAKSTTSIGTGFRYRRPGHGGRHVVARELTLMFTDITGFTHIAETLPAKAVAELLRRHFRTLARCIEREHGRIDTIMGDGLVAVWVNHGTGPAAAAPALRAALGIRAAIEKDNGDGAGRDHAPIRLRVGVHAGSLVEVRLGTNGHLGPTLCGDTVNVAQRLEDAARSMAGAGAVTIVVSDAVVARAGDGFRFEPLGELPVRGRTGSVLAFRLGETPDVG